jgi:cyclomaltodextrinase / maltogenic alpha-amylase / neopullulanase
MQREAVYHRPKQNWAYAYDKETIHLRIRTKRGDVDRVDAVVGDKYAWERTTADLPMRVFASDEMFDYWETSWKPPYRRLRYGFRFYSGDEITCLTEKGFAPDFPDHCLEHFDYPFINPVDVFEPPAWVRDAVFYQIFPDRFANGDPANDPDGVRPWGSAPAPDNFFGGDLQGVLDRLDHLTELGVNAIYFNPLFAAQTNHKYDTRDYMAVDPGFGTNEQLRELVDACRSRGIRVMLDAVFNHAGSAFPPFIDVLQRGEASPYRDWFHVRKFPLRVEGGIPTYDTFAFEPIMPKLNTENPEVKAYLLRAATYWIEEIGIDGWRLDVADEADHWFWREFRQAVKRVKPDAYIVGEVWHDAAMWLQGDQFDAIMNYSVASAVLDYIGRGKMDAPAFADAVGSELARYPRQVVESMLNLLGSHDTPRLLTVCGSDTRCVRLAVLFQLTYPGAPCIYYGDEFGMEGGGDPDCRRCMVWEEEQQNRELFRFFQGTIALRKRHEALRSADIRFLAAEPGSRLLRYERIGANERFLIAMNAGEHSAACVLPDDGPWFDAYSGVPFVPGDDRRSFRIPAFDYVVLRSPLAE